MQPKCICKRKINVCAFPKTGVREARVTGLVVANFRLLGDCLLWAILEKNTKVTQMLWLLLPRKKYI
jgi:hypothetical protein